MIFRRPVAFETDFVYDLYYTTKQKMNKSEREKNMFDIIVIGKGPAGVSAAIYGARANKKVLVIARDFGWLAKTDSIENYYGFEQPVKAMDLLQTGIRQAERLGVTFEDGEVTGVEKLEDFTVFTTASSYSSKTLILAAGMPRNKAAISNLAAYEGRGVSYCTTCDGFFYRGKTAGVVGNGDYAYKEASELLHFTKNITLFTNGREYKGQTPPLSEFDPNIRIDARKIRAIEGTEKVERLVFDDGQSVPVDGLFIAEGSASALDFAYKIGIENDGKTITTDRKQRTNVPGLFAAGDCTGGILQVSVAVGEGAAAGMSAIEYLNQANRK